MGIVIKGDLVFVANWIATISNNHITIFSKSKAQLEQIANRLKIEKDLKS